MVADRQIAWESRWLVERSFGNVLGRTVPHKAPATDPVHALEVEALAQLVRI